MNEDLAANTLSINAAAATYNEIGTHSLKYNYVEDGAVVYSTTLLINIVRPVVKIYTSSLPSKYYIKPGDPNI